MEVKKELEPFRGTLDAKRYVEGMSSRMVAQAQNNTKEFDPKPFIKAFESTMSDLIKLKKMAVRKVGDLEDATKASDSTYRGKVVDLSTDFEQTHQEFRQLETRISQVGNKAVLIGEQLENIDKQRLRALEAKDLVHFFQEFNDGNSSRLDLLKNSTGWEGKAKAAKIARRLNAIAKEIDLPVVEKARTSIEKYSETIEKEMLHEFDQAYKDGDTTAMAVCAKILIEFNGGQSCIQAYVNQHEFFTARMKVFDVEMSYSTTPTPGSAGKNVSKTEADYEAEVPALDRMLGRLYQEVRRTIEKEWIMVSLVFPNAVAVMQLFAQRIFAQSIQSYVETILKRLEEQSLSAYLRSLCSIHAATLVLEGDLKRIAESHVKDPAIAHTFIVTVIRCREDLFVPYIDNDKYIEKETRCLQQTFQTYLQPFYEFQNARKLRTKNQGMFTKLSAAAAPMMGDFPAAPMLALENAISVDNVAQMILVHREAMLRCKELSIISELARNASNLFYLILDTVGKKYVDTCLEYALEDLLAMEPKTEPDLRFLSIIRIANTIVHNIQNYFQTSVVPLISTQPTIHRETVIRKNEFMTALETKINVILQKELDAISTWLRVILSKQKKNDYRPKDNDFMAVALGSSSASTCAQCCEYISKAHTAITKNIDGKNLNVFLTELGIQFYSMLLEHLKKFVISVSGGLVLTKDLAKYQETVSTFRCSAVHDRFETLRQLANVYVVMPENLKPLIEEGVLARLDPKVLHSFVANRADYKQAKLDSLFHGLVVEEEPPAANAWEKGFETAVEAVGDMAGEVGEAMKKMLLLE